MKPTVMIVEDEASLVTMLRYNLEKEGYNVTEASDGEEAVTVADETPPPQSLPKRLRICSASSFA